MINKLNPNIVYPLRIIKGSYEQRQTKVEHLCKCLYKEIEPRFHNGYIKIEEIDKVAKKILPQNIGLKVRKFTQEECINWQGEAGQFVANFHPDRPVISSLRVKYNLKEKNKILKEHLPMIIHEFRHLFDALFHPKFLSREQKIAFLTQKYDRDYYPVFEDFLYRDETKVGIKKVKNFLRNFNIYDQIEYLQQMRYTAITEANAYRTEFNIAKKMNKHCQNINDFYCENIAYMSDFDGMIKILEDMLLKTIAKARRQHSEQLKYVSRAANHISNNGN